MGVHVLGLKAKGEAVDDTGGFDGDGDEAAEVLV